MDDWGALAPTRLRLRQAIRTINEILGWLRVGQHSDKTFIGRIRRGFDSLGYQFAPGTLRVAHKTLKKFVSQWTGFVSRQHAERRCIAHAPSTTLLANMRNDGFAGSGQV